MIRLWPKFTAARSGVRTGYAFVDHAFLAALAGLGVFA
jgi:hypothetical protein